MLECREQTIFCTGLQMQSYDFFIVHLMDNCWNEIIVSKWNKEEEKTQRDQQQKMFVFIW